MVKAGKYARNLFPGLLAGPRALCEDRPGSHHPQPQMQMD